MLKKNENIDEGKKSREGVFFKRPDIAFFDGLIKVGALLFPVFFFVVVSVIFFILFFGYGQHLGTKRGVRVMKQRTLIRSGRWVAKNVITLWTYFLFVFVCL